MRVNADLKHAIGARVAVPTKTRVNSAAEAHMSTIETTIEKSGQRVKAYFLQRPASTMRSRFTGLSRRLRNPPKTGNALAQSPFSSYRHCGVNFCWAAIWGFDRPPPMKSRRRRNWIDGGPPQDQAIRRETLDLTLGNACFSDKAGESK
jgi:hypothetical protein